MNLLVTGGLGFIGSYIIDVFRGKGHSVGIIDRTVPDYFIPFVKDIDIYLADITSPIEHRLNRDYSVLVHLAAANDLESRDAKKALEVTTLGTKNCLDFCRKNGINNFIYFSTFQVYGRESGYVDELTPVACKNDYALTHFFAEEYVKMYHRAHGLDYITVRPTNIFGAFKNKNINRWSLVPNCFIKEAFETGKITLYTSGRQVRDFVSLEDVSNITSILCERFHEQKNNIFNIAGGKSISIIDVAEMTRRIYQRLFDRKCVLDVKSTEPVVGEDLNVNIRRIEALSYSTAGEHTIENDIVCIFEMLKDT